MIPLAAAIRLLPPTDTRTDGELLTAFGADGDEAAFAELLRRHGPMVWGVCRRLLPDRADAEDAFQAAFLVLVRRSHRLTSQGTVGPWLYRVAAWTARNLRRKNARRLARRVALSPSAVDPTPDPEAAGPRLDLDAALLALPEKYRAALVLCHLQGFSRRDAAARLGCPEGTLSSLLARGLVRLRARLAGYDPAKALAVGTAAVPAVLLSTTARAAASSRLAASAAVSVTAAQLAEGVLRMFWVQKATAASVALAAVFALGVGVGVSVREVPAVGGDGPPTKPGIAPAGDPEKELARLRVELAAAEDTVRLMEEGITLAKKGLEIAEKRGKPDDVATARTTVAAFETRATVGRKQRDDLKTRIKELEAKAQPKPADPLTPEDLDRELARLKVEHAEAGILLGYARAKAEESRKDLAAKQGAKPEELAALRQKAVTDERNAEVLLGICNKLEARIKELEAKAQRPKAAGGSLEVDVGGKEARGTFSVKETDAGGKLIGTASCDTPEVLTRLLTRVMKDPDGPRVLVITAPADAPYERVKTVLEACKAAGFTEASFWSGSPGPERELWVELRIALTGNVEELLKTTGRKPSDPTLTPPKR